MATRNSYCGFYARKIQLLILLTLLHLLHASSVQQEVPRAGVLDADILPENYVIHVRPNYDTSYEEMKEFNGTVSIVLTLKEDKTESFILNAAENITVQEVELYKDGKTKINDTKFDQPDKNEKLTIKLEKKLDKGSYVLNITYQGLFTEEGMVGFYKSAYTTKVDGEEETRYLLTTKFEPTHARKAFPCFDEPSFKAKFKISVDVLDDYWALSNTVEDTAGPPDSENITTIYFKETAKMSTYLVAFIIYEKESFSRTHTMSLKSDVELTAWGPREDVDEEHLLDFSQIVSRHSVEGLESFTDIPYNNGTNMTKIDQVAIKNFASGAMENWGLITYKETSMFYSEEKDSETQKKGVAMTLTHELAHQWFGNLVTMNWWSNTWLNEGFARFFQYYILNGVYPEWRMMEQILVDRQQSIFVSDAEESAKALTHDVETFEDIKAQFGTMTYDKGASFLRMIYYIMGDDNFRDAIRFHLNARAYNNVEPADFWTALSKYIPSDVRLPEAEKEGDVVIRSSLAVALETWTLQPGFPVLKVKRNYMSNSVTFSQERFLLNGKRDNGTKYWIPVTWSIKRDKSDRKIYILEDEEKVTDTILGLIDYYILVHSKGYYRVNYDTGNWLALSLKLNNEGKDDIEAVDRAQLVDDAFALAQVGFTKYNAVVPLLRYLRLEEDPLPWVAAFMGFSTLDRLLTPTDTDKIFYSFIQESIGLLYREIGLGNGATHVHRVHQANIILWACRSGHADCLKDVSNLATEYFNEETTIKTHLRRNVLCYAIRHKTDEFWQKAFDRLDKDDRSDILAALTCTRDEARLKQLLNMDLDETETTALYSNINSNPEGLDTALEYFISNYNKISTSNPKGVKAILKNFGQRIGSKENEEKITNFFNKILEEDKDFDAALVTEVEEAIKENLDWLDNYGDNALKAFGVSLTTTTTTTTTKSPGGDDGGQSAIEPLPILLISALFTWCLRNA